MSEFAFSTRPRAPGFLSRLLNPCLGAAEAHRLPPLPDSRCRRAIRGGTRPERVAALREFLDAAARRADAGARPGRRIERFYPEHRRSDFPRHPADLERGELLGVLQYRPTNRAGAAGL